MFRYINVKVNSRIIKTPISSFEIESVLEAKSILLESNQIFQNQFCISRINFVSSKSGTKHKRFNGLNELKHTFEVYLMDCQTSIY